MGNNESSNFSQRKHSMVFFDFAGLFSQGIKEGMVKFKLKQVIHKQYVIQAQDNRVGVSGMLSDRILLSIIIDLLVLKDHY